MSARDDGDQMQCGAGEDTAVTNIGSAPLLRPDRELIAAQSFDQDDGGKLPP